MILPIALIPDGDEARDWAEKELSDPAYDAAEPTFIDRVAQAIGDFLGDLFGRGVGTAWNPILAIVISVVVIGVIVAAFLIWGRPRLAHRTADRSAELFGQIERRSAAELRRAAAAHAAAAEWDAAVVVRFRALARALAERDIVDPSPGTTAQALARDAAFAFPAHAGTLSTAAEAFDDVRYLRRPGSAELYALVERADDGIAASRPVAPAGMAIA